MVIGSVLLRPQPMQRAIALGTEATLTDDLISLLIRLGVDAGQGGPVLEAIALSVAHTATRIVERSGAGLSVALNRMASLFQPLIQSMTRLVEGDLEEVSTVLNGTEQLLNQVVQLFQDLPTEQLRSHIATILDVLETDLGITPDWVETQILGLFDDLIERLQQIPEDATSEQQSNRQEVAILLRRLKRHLFAQITFPEFNADQITSALLSFLRQFRSSTDTAACVGTGLAKTLRVGQSLADLVPYTGLSPLGPGSVGAAAAAGSEEYCWYASWLLENENRGGFLFKLNNWLDFDVDLDERRISEALRNELRDSSLPLRSDATVEVVEEGKKWRITNGEFKYLLHRKDSGIDVDLDRSGSWFFRTLGFLGFPGDKVWVNRERTQVLLGDRILHEGTNVNWYDTPLFSGDRGTHYTFKHATPETTEHLAYHSAWASDGLETLLHLVSLERGDYASNSFNAVWNVVNLIVKLVAKRPLSDYITHWGTGSISIVGTLLASLEGMHTRVSAFNWFAFWVFVLLVSDMGEKALYGYWLNMARNLLLSFTTLLNYEGARVETDFLTGIRDRNRPQNRVVVDGVVNVFVDLSLIWLAYLVPRDEYIFPFASVDLTLGYGIGAALGMGLLGGFVGTVIAESIAWAEDWEVLGYSLLKSMLWSVSRFWPYLYILREGDTDGGRYNPTGPAFSGYPDSDTSPYNLPYEAGSSILWGQCNQGMWSHHFTGEAGDRPQVYAFDLAMDQDDEVLAMRPGTVVDFFDWVPNDENVRTNRPAFPAGTPPQMGTLARNWNFIMIRHDRNEDGTLIPVGSLPPNPNPLNSPHDLDQGGGRVVTYSVYGHGRNGSVRDIFATRLGIPVANILPNAIIGQTVLRGQPIMRAGDTGVSFHNHLHIQVMVGPATGVEVRLDNAGGTPPSVNNYTIPFLFREIDGVPKVLNSYLSQNTRRP